MGAVWRVWYSIGKPPPPPPPRKCKEFSFRNIFAKKVKEYRQKKCKYSFYNILAKKCKNIGTSCVQELWSLCEKGSNQWHAHCAENLSLCGQISLNQFDWDFRSLTVFFSSKDPKRIGAENNLIGAKKYLGAETGHLQRWGLEFKLKRKKYNFFKWRLHASIKIRFLEEKSQWYYLRHNFSPHHHYTVLITDYWVLIIVKIIKMIVKILTLSWSSLIRPLSVSEVVRSSSVLNSWFCDHDDHGDDHVDHDEWVCF